MDQSAITLLRSVKEIHEQRFMLDQDDYIDYELEGCLRVFRGPLIDQVNMVLDMVVGSLTGKEN
jgi:hypothetical protein